ncbi:MAG: D-glycero-beta-D-manno-heptose-7-phosphate kinase [Flavobacteriales bacterium]|nr:MAG: D-glycero-beta-D-manno-heptose-7-phosphate kinase [Flavobacteriales bacterium]
MNPIQTLFSSFSKKRVLIIGDVMIDSYIIGKVDRVSPEAPVPVVDVTGFDQRLGGAGNVALNIKAMGATPILCSVVGHDKEGKELREIMMKASLTCNGLIHSDKRKTTNKTRILGNNHQLLRIDHEITKDLDVVDTFLLEQRFTEELENCDVVIFEDYNKGVLHSKNIELLIQKCVVKGIPTIVDPKKANFLAYKNVTLFKPNLKEIKEGLKIETDLSEQSNLNDAISQLMSSLNNEFTLVTLSERGVVITGKSKTHHIPAHIRTIADVSGAGDTVVSIAALCLSANTDAKTLAELSNLAGGLVCEITGVVPINKEQLLAEAIKVLGK